MSKRRKIHSHYEWRIAQLRENHDILDWADAESQQVRFKVLVENVNLAGKTLLDVGAGLGDLWGFLKKCGIPADYTGVDLMEKMVAKARQRHSDGKFVCGDIFSEDCFKKRRFDVVFCSGIFNLNLGNNMEFLSDAVCRLYELSREYVVFNLLRKRTNSHETKYFYYEPAEVLEILTHLPCKARIVDDYLPNDFTVICHKRSTGK